MPVRQAMLQIEVTQVIDATVLEVPELYGQAAGGLSGAGKTTVREIAFEKIGGAGFNRLGAIFLHSVTGYAKVLLGFQRQKDILLLAPSHVPSPAIQGAAIIFLQVTDTGFGVTPPADIVVARKVGAHVYYDEETQP